MSSPSLRDVQQWFASRVSPHQAPGGTGPDLLNAQRGTPGTARLSVYAGGYIARIRQALAEVYPALAHVMGEGAFTELSGDYARTHPSHEYNLSFAGRHLPGFLASWPRTAQLPFLPDLARLEWLVCMAFHAFDEPPMDLQALAQLSPTAWERLRVVFQPSVGLVASAWPILDIWNARTRPRNEIAIDLVNRPQRVLVSRQGMQVRCALLEPAEYDLLAGLLAQRTLGEVCGALAASEADAMPPVAAWCSAWAKQGLIIRCDADGEASGGGDALQAPRSSLH